AVALRPSVDSCLGTTICRQTRRVIDACFSPQGTQLYSLAEAGEIRAWELSTGKQISRFESRWSSATSFALAPDGDTLAWGQRNGFVEVRSLANRFQEREVTRHEAAVTLLRFSPDGNVLLSGGEDKVLRASDTATGKELWSHAQLPTGPRDVRFSP